MITITTPAQINSVLGGNSPVDYDKMVISRFTLNSQLLTINGTLSLSSTTAPEMQEIAGTLEITPANAVLEISVPQLGFYRRVVLTGPQNDSVMSMVRNAQNSVEKGLIAIGIVDGVQSLGA